MFGLQGQVEPLTDDDQYHDKLGKGKIGELSTIDALSEDRKLSLAFIMHAGDGAEKDISERLREIERKNAGEISSTNLEHRMVRLIKLPEPLDMEVGLVLASQGRDDEMNLVTDRSVMQAREFGSYITPGASLGLLFGQMHQSQVLYCLTNPEYDPHASVARAREALPSL